MSYPLVDWNNHTCSDTMMALRPRLMQERAQPLLQLTQEAMLG